MDDWSTALEPHREPAQAQGLSVMGAVFNVVNLFMGVALLSIVYAVAQGGWISLLPLALSGAFMCLSACSLGLCLEEFPKGARPSYADAAALTWGRAGRVASAGLCFMELFGNACMNLIVMWHEVESLLSSAGGSGGLLGLGSHNAAVLIGSAALLPFFLMGDLRALSYLSLVGIVCTIVVTLSVLSLVVVDPGRTAFPEGETPGHELANRGALLGVGIFSIALSQHSALPSVRNSLARPESFRRVMVLSFAALVSLFMSVGAAGYFYFGTSAHEIITKDLDVTWIGRLQLLPGFSMNSLLILLVGLQGLTAIPMGIAVLQDTLWSMLKSPGVGLSISKRWAVAIRYGLFAILAALSYVGYDILGAVEGLIGGLCSMTCSLLMPVLLFATLSWRRLSATARAALAAITAAAAAVLVLVVATSCLSILRGGGGGGAGNSFAGGGTPWRR